MSDQGSLNSSLRQRSSTEEDVSPLSSHELDSPFEVPALPDGVGLKPCLDSIFADVQAHLPSIDFDVSDFSSDDDLQILTRSTSNSKSTKSKRRNLTPEFWKSAVSSTDPVDILEETGYEFQDPFSLSDKSTDGKDSGVSVTSSNGRHHREGLSSRATSHHDDEEPSSGGEAGQTTHRMLSSSDSFSSQSDDDTLEVVEEIIGFKNIPLELDLGEATSIVNQVESESRSSGINGRRSTEMKRKDNGQTSARRLKFDTYMPSGVPVLETGPIDHIDLDLLLDAFPERQAPPKRGRDRYPLPSHGAGDVQEMQDSKSLQLMNQLAHLCIEQSGGTVRSEDLFEPPRKAPLRVKPSAGRRTVKLAWQEGRTNSEVQTVAPADLSLNLSSLQEDAASPPREDSSSSKPKEEAGEKRETIFLDLRNKDENLQPTLETEHPEAVRRILRLHSPSESLSSSDEESDDEDPLVAWHHERRKALARAQEVKSHDASTVVKNDVADKERDKLPRPPRVIPFADETTSKSQSGSSKLLGDRVPPTPPQSPATATPPRKDSSVAQELEKHQRAEIMKRLREEREAERQSRCRLQSQLNAMKPTMSSSKKHPAAQNTPIVFDMDSSYSVTPDPLPPFLRPEDETVLLTARLSKLGELAIPRSADGPISNSGTYSVFLSFMLSIVPTSFDFITDRVIEKSSEGQYLDSIPFRVVGLQQVFQEGELLLNIAVVPKISEASQFFKTKSRKPKNEKRSSTPFQNVLTKFFVSNTLQSLCPWLEELSYFAISDKGDLISSPPGSRYESCMEDGTYLPPVPQVTTRPLSTFLSINPDPMAASRVFCIPVSFFWQTVDTGEHLQPHIPKNIEQDILDIQNTMSLIYKSLFTKPLSVMGVLHHIFQENLEVVGLRLLFINGSVLKNPSAIHPQGQLTSGENCIDGPVLALALRGSDARSVWLDAVGPSDPVLAQRTDPKSLMANYGGHSREELVIYCPRNPNRINYDLSFWFGGRVPPGGVVDLKSLENNCSRVSEGGKKKKGKKGMKKDSQQEESLEEFPVIRTHVSTLVASTPGDIFLTIAPLVPPVCLGMISSVCHKRGFLICGVKRMRLNSKRAASLGLSGAQVRIFSPVSCTTPTSPKNYEDELRSSIESGFPTTTSSPMPSTILLLRKENSLHHSSSLQETLMVTLSVKGILAAIKENCGVQLTSGLCFHITPYSDNLLATLGGDFNKVPSYERYSSSCVPPSFYSNPELEQIVVTAFTGAETLRNVGDSLGMLLGMSLNKEDHFSSVRERGLELLGLKFIPALNMAQAKELTPFEVGTSNWQESVQFFSSQPSLICIMRGVDAFQRVHLTLKTPITPRSRRQLPQDALKVVMSLSPEIAYRQAAHFFRDHELFSDSTVRENLKFLPPLRSPSLEELSTARFSWAEEPPLSPGGKKKVKAGAQKNSKGMLIVEESIFKTMLTGPRLLTTLLLIKPFAVNKHLSKILKRVLQEDFTMVAMKMLLLSPDQASLLVPSETRSDRIISSMHVEHLMSGPCLALCLQRENAVKKLLDILGPANPREAKLKNQFLWRGLYGADPVNNALHGSESYANAVQEIKLFFPDGLNCTETPDLRADGITAPGVDQILGFVQAKKRQFKLRNFGASSSNSFTSVSSSTSTSSLESPSSHRSSTGVSASPSEISLPSHSALCQTSCLLLTPILQLLDVGSHRKGYVEVIEALLSHGFEIVAMRMFWLTRNQADHFLTLHDIPSPDMNKMLCHGPCIAIAVQRDNAVNCFESSLGSNLEKDSIINKYGNNILRPNNTEAACRYLEFFFDELMPQSQGYILEVDV